MQLKQLFIPLSLLLLVACQTTPEEDGATKTDETIESGIESKKEVTLIFTSDLNGGSVEGTNEQFDLYSAELNLDTAEVSEVKQLITSPEEESVPSIDPEGLFVVFNRTDGEDSLGFFAVNLLSLEVNEWMSEGKNPEFSSDGKQVVYSGKKNILYVSDVREDGAGLTNEKAITTKEQGRFAEPSFSYDSKYVLAYKFNEKHVSVAVVEVATGKLWNITPEDGTGHCNFSPDDYQIVCDKGEILGTVFNEDETLPMETVVGGYSKENIVSLDEDFTSCENISLNYPNFCADSDHLLMSLSCKIDRKSEEPNFSKLFIYNFSTETLHPLGQSLEDAFGGTGFSSRSASCTSTHS